MRSPGESISPKEQYERFIRSLAPSARARISPPATIEGWDRRLAGVRAGLTRSFGRVPESPCPLDPEILGIVRRDGYLIERLTFQSRPGVRVTANLYRPENPAARRPAVLSVHGHWSWARIDPVVQSRCIGLARLGFVCLCVDAFGSGERAIEPAPGTYHGALLGASLWPVGTPLLGLQVYDNRRAVDYLVSRPEVDPDRLAITGASGGGNQTMYAGATDDRLKAVVPVCGIGTLEAYLVSACCVCEVNAGGLTYSTTGDLLAMVAPRALLVISATKDAFQFSVNEAAKSVAYARERFRLLKASDRLAHLPIESGHDYGKTMREAMYGWLDLHLGGRGDGKPVPEPDIQTEDPSGLRCYPDAKSRPTSVATIPEFVRREGQSRLAALPPAPDHKERWQADSMRMKAQLRDRILGGFPTSTDPDIAVTRPQTDGPFEIAMTPEPGLRLTALLGPGSELDEDHPIALLVSSAASTLNPPRPYRLALSLRAIGEFKPGTPAVAGIPDHNEAEWGLWLGRPLLGQWVWDLLRWIEVIDSMRREPPRSMGKLRLGDSLILRARGPIGLAALLAGIFDDRVDGVLLEDGLISFVNATPRPWATVPMGVVAPNLLDVGDIGHLAALLAPRTLILAGGRELDGSPALALRLKETFDFCWRVYALLAPSQFKLVPSGAGLEETIPH